MVSGTSPDERLVEIIEIADHPFFVASQFHPEFKSAPSAPRRCSATSSAPRSSAAGASPAPAEAEVDCGEATRSTPAGRFQHGS